MPTGVWHQLRNQRLLLRSPAIVHQAVPNHQVFLNLGVAPLVSPAQIIRGLASNQYLIICSPRATIIGIFWVESIFFKVKLIQARHFAAIEAPNLVHLIEVCCVLRIFGILLEQVFFVQWLKFGLMVPRRVNFSFTNLVLCLFGILGYLLLGATGGPLGNLERGFELDTLLVVLTFRVRNHHPDSTALPRYLITTCTAVHVQLY